MKKLRSKKTQLTENNFIFKVLIKLEELNNIRFAVIKLTFIVLGSNRSLQQKIPLDINFIAACHLINY